MMVGEIDYRSAWLEKIQNGDIQLPLSVISLIMIVIFIFLMPVLVMNLMVNLQIIAITLGYIIDIKCYTVDNR